MGISQLSDEDDVAAKSVAKAINAVMNQSSSIEEKLAIERIESLRSELEASSTKIAIMDYGAGSPGLNLTAEEMCRGRVVTRTIGEVCHRASTPRKWATLLFMLIRELRPSVCLELGTALGISAAYQAAALELNGMGIIVTLEGADSLGSLAQMNLEKLALKRGMVRVGRFQDVLPDVLAEHPHINFAFIDGHHDEHATLAYYEQIFPFLSEDATVVFDDISWSEGMRRAWNTIVSDSRTRVSVDLDKLGICIVGRSPEKKMGVGITFA